MIDTIPDGFNRPTIIDPLINQVLESRYRIDEEVGRGGMGVVYRGTDLTLSRPVAIKTILHIEANEESLRRFINEARTLAQIETPRLVPVYAVGQDEGYHYIVMKFLEGEDLSEIMKREGMLAVDRVIDITCQVCEALTALHERGIVHRDIKPANLMISPDGKVTVMDLGIAKGMGETPTSSAMGTPKYMPPEAIDNKPLDARADLYSLAIIAYQALVGKVPFDGPTPMAILYQQAHQPPPAIRDLAPHVPKSIENFIEKALQKDPFNRFQSATEMARALTHQEEYGSRSAFFGYLIASLALGGLAWVLTRPPVTPGSIPTPTLSQNNTVSLNSSSQSSQNIQEIKRNDVLPQDQSPNEILITPYQPIQNPPPQSNQQHHQTTPQNTTTTSKSTTSKSTTNQSKKRSESKGKLIRVRVSSTPPKAKIYYKGKQIGQTPYTIEKLESESWPITLKLKGFNSTTKNLQDKDIRIKLESPFGGF